jgi:hypothetical protein
MNTIMPSPKLHACIQKPHLPPFYGLSYIQSFCVLILYTPNLLQENPVVSYHDRAPFLIRPNNVIMLLVYKSLFSCLTMSGHGYYVLIVCVCLCPSSFPSSCLWVVQAWYP